MFVSISKHLFSFLELVLLDEVERQLHEDAAMGVAHAHHRLIDIKTWLFQSTKLKLLHQTVVGALRVEVLRSGNSHAILCRGEWCDAVDQTLLHEVVAEVHVVVFAHRCSYVDRSCPVALGNHFEHHQVTLIERTLS